MTTANPTFYIDLSGNGRYVHMEQCSSAKIALERYYQKYPNAQKGATARTDPDMDKWMSDHMPEVKVA